MNCSHATAAKLFVELDAERGVGLIEIRNQGMGRPRLILVKRLLKTVGKPAWGKDFKKVEVIYM